MTCYSQDIINAEAVVFLGAGASCPLGFKDLDGLMKLAIGKIQENEEWLEGANRKRWQHKLKQVQQG